MAIAASETLFQDPNSPKSCQLSMKENVHPGPSFQCHSYFIICLHLLARLCSHHQNRS